MNHGFRKRLRVQCAFRLEKGPPVKGLPSPALDTTPKQARSQTILEFEYGGCPPLDSAGRKECLASLGTFAVKTLALLHLAGKEPPLVWWGPGKTRQVDYGVFRARRPTTQAEARVFRDSR